LIVCSHVLKHAQDFDSQVMQNLELVDASLDGTVTYEIFIAPNFSNLNSTCHVPFHRFQLNSARRHARRSCGRHIRHVHHHRSLSASPTWLLGVHGRSNAIPQHLLPKSSSDRYQGQAQQQSGECGEANGHDPRRYDEPGRKNNVLYSRAPQGKRPGTARAP